MLSDDSSSDSETGRFKGHSEKKDNEQRKNQRQRDDRLKSSSGRSRHSDNNRLHRDLDRRDDRNRFNRRSAERHRFSRHSPTHRRRSSKERSLDRHRRSVERHRHARHSPRGRDNVSGSGDKKRDSESKSRKSSESKRDSKDNTKSNISTETRTKSTRQEGSKSTDKRISPVELKTKLSVVHKPSPKKHTRNSESPIVNKIQPESDVSDEVQPVSASYYNLIPVVDEKSVSSITDSSDDERLRAKLLNLEKELDKTRKKKHRKKHRKRSSKPKSKEKDRDGSNTVEVSSTTDIQENAKTDDVCVVESETPEVSSTQSKHNKKESSEEGEISSDDDDDDSQNETVDIDPSDLRHKLKRSAVKESSGSPSFHDKFQNKGEICGPALPPHLEKRFKKSISPDKEGPVLPPHLKHKEKNIGPTLSSKMRVVLAETVHTVIACENSDEDEGIGPLPAGSEDKWSDAHKKLEERALDIKIKKLDGHSIHGSDVKTREKWMLELPEAKAKYLGLEARTFRAKEGPDMSDRSSWTDTPEQKARKAAGLPAEEEDSGIVLKREAHSRYVTHRDAEQEHAARKHKKKHKRDESLLDMHQKKLKKKKKKEDKEEGRRERRPFSRDVDLQVNRFDEAQKNAVIKKAQHLDSRFSRGEAKYL